MRNDEAAERVHDDEGGRVQAPLSDALTAIGLPPDLQTANALRRLLEKTLMSAFDPNLSADEYGRRILRLHAAGILFLPKRDQ